MEDIIEEKHKSVSFCPVVHVILIPSVPDYRKANLCQVLWWNADDYDNFKGDALTEINHFLQQNKGLKGKDAIRHLYLSSTEHHPQGNHDLKKNDIMAGEYTCEMMDIEDHY